MMVCISSALISLRLYSIYPKSLPIVSKCPRSKNGRKRSEHPVTCLLAGKMPCVEATSTLTHVKFNANGNEATCFIDVSQDAPIIPYADVIYDELNVAVEMAEIITDERTSPAAEPWESTRSLQH